MFSRVLAWCVVAFVLTVAPFAYADSTTVFVFSFENDTNDRNIDWIGEGLSDLISDRLSAENQLYVFNRDERTAAYDRLGIPETVAVSRATAIKISWDVGADTAIIGAISGTHEDFKIHARILDLAGSSSVRELEVSGKLDDVIPLAARLAAQLAKTLVPDSTVPESDYIVRPPVPRSAFEAYVRGSVTADPQRRVQLLQDAIRLHPQYSAALYQLGRAWHFDMNLAAASPLLERIPPGAPEYLQARFILGLNYYYLGDYAKAAAVFMALPPTYDDLINLGAALASRGDLNGAQAAWRRASNRDPLRTESFFNLAWLAFNRGDMDAASRSLDQFFRLQGRDAEALFLQGRVYERQGRTDDSQKAIAQAVRLSPRIERWINQPLPSLQRLRIQADTTELRTALQPSIWSPARLSRRALGQDLTSSLESVQTQMESQLYGDALRDLQDVARVFPQAAEVRLLRGQVYEKQRQNDLAIREYRESIQLKPSADAWVLLAKLYRAMNQSGPALQAVTEALTLEPSNFTASSLKAELERATARPRQ